LAGVGLLSQEKPAPRASLSVTLPRPATIEPACSTPAEMLQIEDYHGPLSDLILSISRKPEILTTHQPHHVPGAKVCSLKAGEKFHLFVSDTVEPVSFFLIGFEAAFAQLQNDDPTFAQGSAGYAKRYGAAFLDQASDEFFTTFLYPSLFRQDPRYYRVAHGPGGKRLAHALEHILVAQGDSGQEMFNYSEWLGTASAQSLANLYHPGNKRGLGPFATGFAITLASDAGWNVLREFWPEVSRKLKLPFITTEHSASALRSQPEEKRPQPNN